VLTLLLLCCIQVLGTDVDGGATLSAIKKLVPSFKHVAFTHASVIVLQPSTIQNDDNDDDEEDGGLSASKNENKVVRGYLKRFLSLWTNFWCNGSSVHSSANSSSGTSGAESTVKSVLKYLLPIAHFQERLRASRRNTIDPVTSSPHSFSSPERVGGIIRHTSQVEDETKLLLHLIKQSKLS